MHIPSGTYRPQRLATELGIETEHIGIVLTERTEHIVLLIVSVCEVGIS